jgi:hypothetical protein
LILKTRQGKVAFRLGKKSVAQNGQPYSANDGGISPNEWNQDESGDRKP